MKKGFVIRNNKIDVQVAGSRFKNIKFAVNEKLRSDTVNKVQIFASRSVYRLREHLKSYYKNNKYVEVM